MPRHYDDSDEDLYENPYAESNPRRRASYGDEYQYFIVDASGEPESGWEYREDAKDALRDGSSGRPGLKVVSRRSVDKGQLAAFFERNRDNPDYAELDTDADDEDVDVVENPASVVRTARDERLWRMAKASAARQGRAHDWPYVMGIFQRMKHHTGGATMNPDDEDAPPPSFQLRAQPTQQPLFGTAAFESVPKPKKKLPPPVDTRQRDLFGLPIDDDEPRENPDDLMQRITARRQAERARREAQLASMHETMAADPGFQQAVRRQQAEATMQRYAAGPQLFKRGDRVVYAGADGAIPSSWRGRVIGYEWHPEWSDDGDGHFNIVRWTTPDFETHEGVYHQSDLYRA